MTTKTARQELKTLFTTWLGSPPAEFDALDLSNIYINRYTTAPDPNSDRAFHITIGTEAPKVDEEGVSESQFGGNLYVVLFARINADDEATKEAAEDWLDDCEQFLLQQMAASRNTSQWTRIVFRGSRRDPDPVYHKIFRVSYIRIGVDLR